MLIFTSIYNVVDGFFVSNYVGKAAFSAVNFIMPFLLMLGAIGFMFGTGGSALIAKTMGEGDTEKPNRIFSLIVYVSVLFGIVIAMLGFIFLRSLTAALGAKNELLENSIKYGRIIKGSISSFLKLEIFHQFRVTPEWGVLKTDKSVRRRGSGCVLFRAFMPYKSSTAAYSASLRCKLGSEQSERSPRRKHSFIHAYFQNSTFDLIFFSPSF